MGERLYTQEEVSRLMERAAALGHHGAGANADSSGLTLAELEIIARDTGLDPALVRMAAAELDGTPRRSLANRSEESDTHVHVERWLPVPLDESVWEEIAFELKHRFDTDAGRIMGMPTYGVGQTERVGRSYEWRHTSLGGVETRILARPKASGTHLRMGQRVGWAGSTAESFIYGIPIALFFGVITGLFAIPAGLTGASPLILGLIVSALFAFAVVPAIHKLDSSWRKKKHRRLEELADALSSVMVLHESEEARSASRQERSPNAAVEAPQRAPETLVIPSEDVYGEPVSSAARREQAGPV